VQARSEGTGTRITAEPKTDSLPYSAVEFVVTAQNRIREVKVTGFDHSTLDFTFEEESLNPALDGKLFQFQAPPGAEVVEGDREPWLNSCSSTRTGGADPPAGRGRAVREGTAGAVLAAGIPHLFGEAAGGLGPGGLGAVPQAQEAQPRKVPDLQPAVRDADRAGLRF